MLRRDVLVLMGSALALSACASSMNAPQLGADGKPLPQVYRIGDIGAIQLRMLDSVNALRQARGAQPLQLSAELNASAGTHARDMSMQNRPWHFGSDGSSPIQRAQRTGFMGRVLGELISETYETETETLGAWMQDPNTRALVLQPEARVMGFNLFQEPNGKIWWTMVTGA